MRVFVLSTGRCGSVTFARAAAHLTNFTTGHEGEAGRGRSDRMAYRDAHVEVDNRLSWLLGQLGACYGDEPFYVHLRRDDEATARSFLKRWQYRNRAGIIEAFAHGIMQNPDEWDDEKKLDVCRYYVDTVNANIAAFLKDKTQTRLVQMEAAPDAFHEVWDRIGGQGDLAAALAEWDVRHNAS